MFKVTFTKDAAKYYEKSDINTKRLLNQCFEVLKNTLFSGYNVKKLHGELEGFYRHRVGKLRVVYTVKNENIGIYFNVYSFIFL
ncbi:UNVERIFIED_CONTAM: mRNA interferase RelE/StbE [Acetivibrio alkalicellulosi]